MGAKKKQINTKLIFYIIQELQSKNEKLTERGISRLLGVSHSYLWQCKDGRQMPNEKVVKKAAELLGINEHELLAVNNTICSKVLSVYLKDPVKYSKIILERGIE